MSIIQALIGSFSNVLGAVYRVLHSLRLDGSATTAQYLSFTPSTTSTSNKFTLSMWIKRDELSQLHYLMAATPDTATEQAFRINANNSLAFFYWNGSTTVWYAETTEVIDDYDWHHVVFAFDLSQSGADKVKIWIDGGSPSAHASGADYPSSAVWWGNSSYQHDIGSWRNDTTTAFSGQLAEVHFIDGQALDASYFGETRNSQWVPKEVTGVTYGNNGFYLDFADSSTASALGTDASTNTNNFTVNGGITPDDQLLDSPNLRFASWDAGHKDAAVTLTDANLTISAAYKGTQRGTELMTSGKWYWETLVSSTPQYGVAIVDPSFTLDADLAIAQSGSKAVGYWTGGQLYDESGQVSSTGASYTTGDVVAIAVDFDSAQKSAKFYKAVNGSLVLQYTYDFGSGSNLSFLSGAYPAWNHSGTSVTQTATVNFGQDHTFAGTVSPLSSPYTDSDGNGEFYYQPPTGFKALATSY